jgi:hypothetical protein
LTDTAIATLLKEVLLKVAKNDVSSLPWFDVLATYAYISRTLKLHEEAT